MCDAPLPPPATWMTATVVAPRRTAVPPVLDAVPSAAATSCPWMLVLVGQDDAVLAVVPLTRQAFGSDAAAVEQSVPQSAPHGRMAWPHDRRAQLSEHHRARLVDDVVGRGGDEGELLGGRVQRTSP